MVGAECKVPPTLSNMRPANGFWKVPKEYAPSREGLFTKCPYPDDCVWKKAHNTYVQCALVLEQQCSSSLVGAAAAAVVKAAAVVIVEVAVHSLKLLTDHVFSSFILHHSFPWGKQILPLNVCCSLTGRARTGPGASGALYAMSGGIAWVGCARCAATGRLAFD